MFVPKGPRRHAAQCVLHRRFHPVYKSPLKQSVRETHLYVYLYSSIYGDIKPIHTERPMPSGSPARVAPPPPSWAQASSQTKRPIDTYMYTHNNYTHVYVYSYARTERPMLPCFPVRVAPPPPSWA